MVGGFVVYIYLQLGLMLFCPPTSHTVRDVFLSRSKVPTLNPMVGDVSITLKLTDNPRLWYGLFNMNNLPVQMRLTCPVSSLASRVDFPAESKPMSITWTHKHTFKFWSCLYQSSSQKPCFISQSLSDVSLHCQDNSRGTFSWIFNTLMKWLMCFHDGCIPFRGRPPH